MNRPKPVAAASYERVSTMVQAQQGYSLGAQRQDATAFAAQQSWVLSPDLQFRDGVDQDASGADWDLPDLNRMFDAARGRRFQVLIVPDHSRLARDHVKAMVIEAELAKYGIRVQYLDSPLMDTEQSAEADLLNHVSHAFSQYDRAKRRRASMRGRRAKAEMGRWVGNGWAPYGYRVLRLAGQVDGKQGRIIGLVPYEPEAVVIRDIFERARTQPEAAILRWLDQQTIPSPGYARGKKGASIRWGSSTLHSILDNTLYKGDGTYGGQQIPVPAIISAELFDEVDLALEKRRRRPGGHQRLEVDPYLLRGRLVCAHCSKPGREWLLRTEAIRDRRYYICANKFASRIDRLYDLEHRCPLPGVRADLVEELAWLLLVEALTNTAKLDRSLSESQQQREAELAKLDGRLAGIQAQIERTTRQLDRAVVRINDLEPDDDELPLQEKLRDDAKRLLKGLRAEHDHSVASTRSAGMSAEEIESLRALLSELGEDLIGASLERRRQVIEMLNVRATVYPLEGDASGEDDVLVQVKPKRYTRIEWTSDIRLETTRGLLKLRVVLRRSRFFVIGIERVAA